MGQTHYQFFFLTYFINLHFHKKCYSTKLAGSTEQFSGIYCLYKPNPQRQWARDTVRVLLEYVLQEEGEKTQTISPGFDAGREDERGKENLSRF